MAPSMRARRLLLLAAAAALGGCYEFEVPLDPTPTRDVDQALLGTWRCLGSNAKADDAPINFVVAAAGPRAYSIRIEASGDPPGQYEGYASEVKGRTVLSVRDVGPKPGDRPWSFARYELLRPDILHVELADEDALKGVPRTSEALRAALEQRDGQPDLYADFCVCVRARVEAKTAAAAGREAAEGWTSLFNGHDLSGWETWLGIPHASVTGLDLPRDAAGKYTQPMGLNTDPRHVFTVVTVDGAPAIRISGEMFGALTSREEYDDFHLRAEFKWGEKKWPPREANPRDSGILYYAVGEQGGADNHTWMRSLECQVQEHDVGDLWAVGGTAADVAADLRGEGKERAFAFRRGAPVADVNASGMARRAIKSADYEKPTGEWNTVEVVCLRGTCVHAVNGKVNLVLSRARQPGKDGAMVPLTRGRLQIQSEGAEVYYRQIAVRKVSAFPKEYEP